MITPDDAALKEMAEASAALILSPHYENYGVAFNRDYDNAVQNILTALRQVRDAAAEDTKRLDWLEKQSNGTGWIARISSTGRGYRLHNTNGGLSYQTAREAIDAAMNAGKGQP